MSTVQDESKELSSALGAEEAKAVPSKTVEQLSSGILSSCESELTSVAKELKAFKDQQDELMKQVAEFNRQAQTNPVFVQLKSAMDAIGAEMARLTLLRQDMSTVQERSQKLCVRAEKLKQHAEEKARRDEGLVAQFADEDPTVGGISVVERKVDLS